MGLYGSTNYHKVNEVLHFDAYLMPWVHVSWSGWALLVFFHNAEFNQGLLADSVVCCFQKGKK